MKTKKMKFEDFQTEKLSPKQQKAVRGGDGEPLSGDIDGNKDPIKGGVGGNV